MKKVPCFLLFAFLALFFAGCGEDDDPPADTSDTSDSADQTPQTCQGSEDCAPISCVCKDGEKVSSFQSCNVVNGVGSCGTCAEFCDGHGGIFTNPAGCLDSTDSTYSSFRGSAELGSACEVAALSSDCESGFCVNDGSGTGFCTKDCDSDADCGDLECKSYSLGSDSFRTCIASSKEWCSAP